MLTDVGSVDETEKIQHEDSGYDHEVDLCA